MRRSGQRGNFRRALAIVSSGLLALIGTSTAFAQQPSGITEEATSMHNLFLFVTTLAIIVFVGVVGALVYILIRYRKRSDELPQQTHGSTTLELTWVGIPVLLVIAMFAYSTIVLIDIDDDAPDDALTVNVTGFQFQWTFAYDLADLGTNTDPNAEGTVSITGTAVDEPELVIPVDEPVEFVLNSSDVIHSFYVRDFLYKLDVIPGHENAFTVIPTKTGTFMGQCAELCGVDHALMRFSVRVVEREEFDQWIAEQSGQDTAARQP